MSHVWKKTVPISFGRSFTLTVPFLSSLFCSALYYFICSFILLIQHFCKCLPGGYFSSVVSGQISSVQLSFVALPLVIFQLNSIKNQMEETSLVQTQPRDQAVGSFHPRLQIPDVLLNTLCVFFNWSPGWTPHSHLLTGRRITSILTCSLCHLGLLFTGVCLDVTWDIQRGREGQVLILSLDAVTGDWCRMR